MRKERSLSIVKRRKRVPDEHSNRPDPTHTHIGETNIYASVPDVPPGHFASSSQG
jgi:hypothetical protein